MYIAVMSIVEWFSRYRDQLTSAQSRLISYCLHVGRRQLAADQGQTNHFVTNILSSSILYLTVFIHSRGQAT